MPLEDLESFEEPTLLQLSQPYRLHPNASNPHMDLVALLHLPTEEDIEQGDDGSSVELWRISGEECVEIWKRDVGGWVVGLDWSLDGLQLSVLSYLGFGASTSAHPFALTHLSVHDGAPVATLNIQSSHAPDKTHWLYMKWVEAGTSWPHVEKGSAGMILDALPSLERVIPALPPHMSLMYQFQPALALKAKKALDVPHASLAVFPTLFPDMSATNPGSLLIPSLDQRLLTGTFPGDGEKVMRLAQNSKRLKEILDIVLKGVEGAQAAWKEALKQGELWKDEMEECVAAAGEEKGSGHAELYALLVTGRSSTSVTDFFSHRLTGRTLTKWKSTVIDSLASIHRLMTQSVIPGLERIMVLLDEMAGWAIDVTYSPLNLDTAAVMACMKVARRLATMANFLDRDAEYKAQIAEQYFAWLAYEVERIHNTDREVPPDVTFNVLDAWEYYEHGLTLEMTFKIARSVRYFTSNDNPPFKGVIDTARLCPEDIQRQKQLLDLDAILTDTLQTLGGSLPQLTPRKPLAELSMEIDPVPEDVSEPSTEHWPSMSDLAPELVKLCRALVTSEKPADGGAMGRPGSQSVICGLHAESYSCDGLTWYAGVATPEDIPSLGFSILWVLYDMPEEDRTCFACVALASKEEDVSVHAVEFFDSSELALVMDDGPAAGTTLLATIEYRSLEYHEVSYSKTRNLTPLSALKTVLSTNPTEIGLQALSIARSQAISDRFASQSGSRPSLALNGRRKRRTACVMSPDGKEMQVFSLWISGVDDEGDDEDDEAEEEDEGVNIMEE